MRTYGQYCPIARASEILAERWTPIIVRNLLNGATTYTQIAEGAPGIPRSLLTSRLRELERTGVVATSPGPLGRGFEYRLTEAGKDLHAVVLAMGMWGRRWLEMGPEHIDPGMVLHSWVSWYLADRKLPDRRVVARFDFPDQPSRAATMWVIFDRAAPEVCLTNPGLEEDLIVTAEARALAEWHMGEVEWQAAIAARRIEVSGPPRLARALPTWNLRSAWARIPAEPATSAIRARLAPVDSRSRTAQ